MKPFKINGKQPIDPGILNLVLSLQAFNIPTQYSCEGHLNRKWSYPHVDIYADNSHINFEDFSKKMLAIKQKWIKANIQIQKKLIPLLEQFYKTRKTAYKYQITPHTFVGLCDLKLKCVGSDLLQIMPTKQRKKELARYQKEMKDFGEFLLVQNEGSRRKRS